MTQLFDDLVQGGAPAVRALMDRHETLELDFKLRSLKDKEVRATLGKALSAFANSMGGLIVWGVNCRKDADGVDHVTGFTPIEGLARFASDMRDWTVEVLMPRHAGIRVEALDEGGDRGFLLVDVERSERRPHRSEAGEKSYFRRAGASSRAMEHFEIEDAFRRVSLPELQFSHKAMLPHYDFTTPDPAGWCIRMIHLDFSLTNVGRVTAKASYIAFDLPISCMAAEADPHLTLRSAASMVSVETTAPLHPQVSRLFARINVPVRANMRLGCFYVPPRLPPISIIIHVGGQDMPMRTEHMTLELEDLIENFSDMEIDAF